MLTLSGLLSLLRSIVRRLANHLERIAHTEAGWQTAWRIVHKRLHEATDIGLRRHEQVGTPEQPILIAPAGAGPHRLLEGILAQVNDAWRAMRHVLAVPDIEASALLGQELELPGTVAECGIVAIVGDVVEFLARAGAVAFK